MCREAFLLPCLKYSIEQASCQGKEATGVEFNFLHESGEGYFSMDTKILRSRTFIANMPPACLRNCFARHVCVELLERANAKRVRPSTLRVRALRMTLPGLVVKTHYRAGLTPTVARTGLSESGVAIGEGGVRMSKGS